MPYIFILFVVTFFHNLVRTFHHGDTVSSVDKERKNWV